MKATIKLEFDVQGEISDNELMDVLFPAHKYARNLRKSNHGVIFDKDYIININKINIEIHKDEKQ